METMRVRHVMHEENEIVGTVFQSFVLLRYGRRILAKKSCACRNCSIEPYAFLIGFVPLAPAVSFGRFYRDAIVVSDNVCQSLQAERSSVVFISPPGAELHINDGFRYEGIVAEGEARPLFSDPL